MAVYHIQGATEKRNGIYYEFDSEILLGEGGMGKVFKGRQINATTGASRNVAVKFMYDDLPPYAIEKARREASIHFRHDNLIEMLGLIETEGEEVLGKVSIRYHVVSELLEGVSLDKFLEGKLTDQYGNYVPFAEKLFKEYRQDPARFAIFLIKNILSGLMTMHDAGYIHRDIDPTNIMITSDGHIKLIDFGIAKKMKSLTSGDKHLTQAGQFVGKPEYAAPELVLGAIDEQNQTTDIYAVGILLFQCLVGNVPFQGDRSDVLQKQIHSPLPLKLIKNKHLRKIIKTATEKSRGNRFQSSAEFRVELERVESQPGPAIDYRKYLYAFSGVAACSLAIWGVVALLDFSQNSEPDEVQPVEISYDNAIKALHDRDNATTGLASLRKLSEQGDADASYLLSRIYFSSKLEDDYTPDSIGQFKNLAGVSADNLEAHKLLKLAVEQNPGNYHALYDLACDYWKADQRTEAVSDRDGDKAERYYRQALEYAMAAGDKDTETKIRDYLSKIEIWKANVSKIKSGQ